MPAYDIFNIYAERVQQRVDYARETRPATL